MASAAEWCQLDSVKFVAQLENLNQLEDGTAHPEPPQLLGPPSIIVQELRILVNGVVVEQIQDFNRTVMALGALMPISTKIMNSMEANLLMSDPYGQEDRVAANLGVPARIQEKRIQCEKYESLTPGEKRTISFSLAPSGLFQSGYLFPLDMLGGDRASEKLMCPSWVC